MGVYREAGNAARWLDMSGPGRLGWRSSKIGISVSGLPDGPDQTDMSDQAFPDSKPLSPKALRTRARMFQITAEIIGREGYSAWSEEYLCELCDCTRGALRYQFPQGRYDLFPAFIASALDHDAAMMSAMQSLTTKERLYLILSSLGERPPSEMTVAMLEIWMASRGDARLQEKIQPLLAGADGRLLGLPEGERDPEVLALFNILFGISLSSVRDDFDPAALKASLDWLLAQLPVPESLARKRAELTKAREAKRFASAG